MATGSGDDTTDHAGLDRVFIACSAGSADAAIASAAALAAFATTSRASASTARAATATTAAAATSTTDASALGAAADDAATTSPPAPRLFVGTPKERLPSLPVYSGALQLRRRVVAGVTLISWPL